MRRFAPRLPVTCHGLNPSPPLVRSSTTTLFRVSFIARIRSSTLRPFFNPCACVPRLYFSFFQQFSKSRNNDSIITNVRSTWIIVRPRTLVLTRNDPPPPPSLSLSLSFGESRRRRQMSDGKERKVQHGRCSIAFSFTILPRLSLARLFHPTFIVSSYPPPPPPPPSCFLARVRSLRHEEGTSERTGSEITIDPSRLPSSNAPLRRSLGL